MTCRGGGPFRGWLRHFRGNVSAAFWTVGLTRLDLTAEIKATGTDESARPLLPPRADVIDQDAGERKDRPDDADEEQSLSRQDGGIRAADQQRHTRKRQDRTGD